MTRFYVFVEGDDVAVCSFEYEVIEYITDQALDRHQTPDEFIHDCNVFIVEGTELLYKPPRDTPSLVLKGK